MRRRCAASETPPYAGNTSTLQHVSCIVPDAASSLHLRCKAGGRKSHAKRWRERNTPAKDADANRRNFGKSTHAAQKPTHSTNRAQKSRAHCKFRRHIFRLSLFWRFFKKSACLKSSVRYKIYLPQEASDTVSERGKSKISAKHVQLTEKGKLQCSTE